MMREEGFVETVEKLSHWGDCQDQECSLCLLIRQNIKEANEQKEDVSHRDSGNIPGQSLPWMVQELIGMWRMAPEEYKRSILREMSEEDRMRFFHLLPDEDIKRDFLRIMGEVQNNKEASEQKEDVGHRDFGNLLDQLLPRMVQEFIRVWRMVPEEGKRSILRKLPEEYRMLLFHELPDEDIKRDFLRMSY